MFRRPYLKLPIQRCLISSYFVLLAFLLLPPPIYAEGLLDIEKEQLSNEAMHILGGGRHPAVRWNDNVTFAFVGRHDAFQQSLATAVFDQISLLTGIETSPLTPSSHPVEHFLELAVRSRKFDQILCDASNASRCANFMIIVVDQPQMHDISIALGMRDHYRKATAAESFIHCFFTPLVGVNLNIAGAIVFVNENQSLAAKNTCLHEEIYQSFGLFSDFSSSLNFSFNNKVEQKHITALDRALITTLYDKNINTGTSVFLVVDTMLEKLHWQLKSSNARLCDFNAKCAR